MNPRTNSQTDKHCAGEDLSSAEIKFREQTDPRGLLGTETRGQQHRSGNPDLRERFQYNDHRE